MDSKKIKAYTNLMFCILIWAAIPVVAKKSLVELDNFQVLFYSTFFSVVIMGVLVLVQKKQHLVQSLTAKDYSKILPLGFLGNCLYYVLLYGALDLTSASEGFILAYVWPILVLVLSFIILKEDVTVKKIVGVSVSFIGIVVITAKGDMANLVFTNNIGNIMAIAAAFVFALFSVLGKKFNYDQTVSVFLYFASAFISLLPTMFIFSEFVLPSLNVLPWLILNGFLINGISYVFWFKALEGGETHVISNLLYLTPFVSLIYIRIFLKEEILMTSILGLLVIIAGVLLQYAQPEKVRVYL